MDKGGSPHAQPSTALLERMRRGIPLRIDAFGRFLFDNDPITHARTIAALRHGLDASDSGEPIVRVQDQWCYLHVDDCVFRVVGVTHEPECSHSPRQLFLRLDDRRTVALDPDSLWEQHERGLRCTVPSRTGRPLAARFTNHAQMELARFLVVDEHTGTPELCLGTRRYPIRSTSPGR